MIFQVSNKIKVINQLSLLQTFCEPILPSSLLKEFVSKKVASRRWFTKRKLHVLTFELWNPTLKAHWQISKNRVSKSIVHMIKYANFLLHRVHPDGVIYKTWQLTTNLKTNYNLVHNILELYNVLRQTRLTTSKTKRDI